MSSQQYQEALQELRQIQRQLAPLTTKIDRLRTAISNEQETIAQLERKIAQINTVDAEAREKLADLEASVNRQAAAMGPDFDTNLETLKAGVKALETELNIPSEDTQEVKMDPQRVRYLIKVTIIVCAFPTAPLSSPDRQVSLWLPYDEPRTRLMAQLQTYRLRALEIYLPLVQKEGGLLAVQDMIRRADSNLRRYDESIEEEIYQLQVREQRFYEDNDLDVVSHLSCIAVLTAHMAGHTSGSTCIYAGWAVSVVQDAITHGLYMAEWPTPWAEFYRQPDVALAPYDISLAAPLMFADRLEEYYLDVATKLRGWGAEPSARAQFVIESGEFTTRPILINKTMRKRVHAMIYLLCILRYPGSINTLVDIFQESMNQSVSNINQPVLWRHLTDERLFYSNTLQVSVMHMLLLCIVMRSEATFVDLPDEEFTRDNMTMPIRLSEYPPVLY